MSNILRVVTLGSHTGLYGGPYDTSVMQAKIAVDNGHSVVLLTGNLKNDVPNFPFISSRFRTAFVRVRRVIPTRGFTGLFSCRYLFSVIRETSVADVVHISLARELIPVAALVVAVIMGKRVIVQPHGMLTSRKGPGHRFADILLKRLVARSSTVIVLTDVESDLLSEWIRPCPSPHFVVLGNPVPIELRPQVRTAPKSSDVLFIARLHPRKRVSVFIEAARLASVSGWSESYSVYGPDGGDLGAVLAADRDVSLNLAYGGAVASDVVRTLVDECGVFVLPSAMEPWGNVLSTAIALGVPVVVTESAALSSQIVRLGAGLVVPDGDAEALARAVHSILLDDRAYSILSAGSARFFDAFLDPDLQSSSLMSVYAG